MNPPDIADFVERQRRERVAAGLAPAIIDTAALRLIAAVVRGGGTDATVS